MSQPLSRTERAALVLLTLTYGLTRIWRLTALPMFFDEAGHLLWGERGSFARAMYDGKLLQVAAGAVTLRLFPDPLWAGRFATVMVGFVALLAAFALGRRVGGRAGGLLTAALYVASPFALFYDRLALADGFVSAFSALVILATIDLARDPRPIRALVLGLALAGAGAAKIPGLLALAFVPAGIVLIAPRDGRAWRWAAASLVLAALLLAVPVRAFLAGTGQIHEKAALVGGGRTQLVAENAATAARWLWTWWTPPLALLGLAGTAVAVARRRGPELLLAFAWLLPVAALVPLARIWYPRYLLPATVPFVVLAATAVVSLAGCGRAGRIGALLAGALAFAPALACDAGLLRDPATAALPPMERWQYVEGWPSGYGWRESYEFLQRERLRHPGGIRVATEARHPVLKAYFIGQPGVDVKAFDFEEPSALARVAAWVGDRPGWLVTSGATPASERDAGLTLEHVAAFTKPGRGGWLNVYRLRSEGARS